jgi:hypothetical protein
MTDRNLLHIVLRAKNDNNGNPRRCSLLLATDCNTVIAVEDHGYKGAPKKWPMMSIAISVDPSEYRWWIKTGENIQTWWGENESEVRQLLQDLGT